MGRLTDRLFWTEKGQAKTDERFQQVRDPESIPGQWRRFCIRTCLWAFTDVCLALSTIAEDRRWTTFHIALLTLWCVSLALLLFDFGLNYRSKRRGDWQPGGTPFLAPDRLWQLGKTTPTLGIAGRLAAALIGAAFGVLVGVILASDWRKAPWVLGYGGYGAALIFGETVARRLDKAGRLPHWARPPDRDPVDYSVPPPADGPIFGGRADQAAFQLWLRKRRAKSKR